MDDKDFLAAVDHMLRCIETCDKGGNHNFGRYRGKNRGCFGIIDTIKDDSINEYISFSGVFDVQDSKIENDLGFDLNKKMSNKQLVIKIQDVVMKDLFFYGAEYANLNLKTKRYPYYAASPISHNGQTIENAINQLVNKKKIRDDYSCCERKIFSFIPSSKIDKCFIFARHEPCSKCKPAIIDLINNTGCKMRILYCENDIIKEFNVSTLQQ